MHGLPPTAVRVGPLEPDDGGPHLLGCDTCRTPVPAGPVTGPQLLDGPCLAPRCPGRLVEHAGDRDSFYRRLYEAAGMRRVDAHEHTSLLDPEDRRAIESGFKRTVQDPGDPNVLVATPTLEMGIDIGDLSAVFLASLPLSLIHI